MLGDIVCIRVKFYIMTNDYSCMLMIKCPNFNGQRAINRDLTLKSYAQHPYL